MPGGSYLYRATLECSFCARVDDVGPFDSLTVAWQQLAPGWVTPNDRNIQIRDGAGIPYTFCPECAEMRIIGCRDVLEARAAEAAATRRPS